MKNFNILLVYFVLYVDILLTKTKQLGKINANFKIVGLDAIPKNMQ